MIDSRVPSGDAKARDSRELEQRSYMSDALTRRLWHRCTWLALGRDAPCQGFVRSRSRKTMSPSHRHLGIRRQEPNQSIAKIRLPRLGCSSCPSQSVCPWHSHLSHSYWGRVAGCSCTSANSHLLPMWTSCGMDCQEGYRCVHIRQHRIRLR